MSNVRVHTAAPHWSNIQALLASGDRRVGQLLASAHANQGNWPQIFKASVINADFYVQRQRSKAELFPCGLIDQGIDKALLWNEYQRALQAKATPPYPMDPE